MFDLGCRLNHYYKPSEDSEHVQSFYSDNKQFTIPLTDKFNESQAISIKALWPSFLTLYNEDQRSWAPPVYHLKKKLAIFKSDIALARQGHIMYICPSCKSHGKSFDHKGYNDHLCVKRLNRKVPRLNDDDLLPCMLPPCTQMHQRKKLNQHMAEAHSEQYKRHIF